MTQQEIIQALKGGCYLKPTGMLDSRGNPKWVLTNDSREHLGIVRNKQVFSLVTKGLISIHGNNQTGEVKGEIKQ